MFELKDLTKNKQYKEQVKKLYISAFPKNERPPFCMLWRRAKKGKGEFYVATNDDNFVGLAHTIVYGDLVYLSFLATDESLRGKSYGSKTLSCTKEIYNGKRIILNIEELDEKADNFTERIKRKCFYERNSFKLSSIKTKEIGVKYELMLCGNTVTYPEYERLMISFVGKTAYKLLFGEIKT